MNRENNTDHIASKFPKSGSRLGFTRESAMESYRRNPSKLRSSLKNLDGSSKRDDLDLSVRFSRVDVRDYSLCLGDNPSVSRGAPISLDWNYNQESSFKVDSYEEDRSHERRELNDLKLPSLQRVHILRDLGYSRGEIKQQTKRTEDDKDRRIATRRKVELEDATKKLVRGIGKRLNISRPFKKVWQNETKTKRDNQRPHFASNYKGDILASSESSKKSDTTVLTDVSGHFVTDDFPLVDCCPH